MAAFMIAAEEEKGIWIPDLERPQVQDTLNFPFQHSFKEENECEGQPRC